MVYLAPGAASGASALRLPGERSSPAVDDHLVKPEITRDEVVRGVRMIASPASPPHGDQHHRLGYVVEAHLRPGYVGSTDLLTRWNKGSDFASDTSIRKAGVDPATGRRFLEEVAFEIVSTQSLAQAAIRAEDMAVRGVRRIFAILTKKGQVREWSQRLRAFQPVDPGSSIRDETLARPLPVKALLDAAVASREVVRALEAKGEPEIAAIKARGEARGRAEGEATGRAVAILVLLEQRGLEVSAEQRARILGCRDLAMLESWLRRAVSAGRVEEVLG